MRGIQVLIGFVGRLKDGFVGGGIWFGGWLLWRLWRRVLKGGFGVLFVGVLL